MNMGRWSISKSLIDQMAKEKLFSAEGRAIFGQLLVIDCRWSWEGDRYQYIGYSPLLGIVNEPNRVIPEYTIIVTRKEDGSVTVTAEPMGEYAEKKEGKKK